MNESEEFARIARAWLNDGPTRMSDRALQSALEEIHVTHQRRAWWPARRNPRMTNLMRAVVAAAIVVGVGAVGRSLLPADPGAGGPGQPSPTTPPSASTDATREFTLTFDEYPFEIHVRAPVGWSGQAGPFVIQKYGGEPPNGMAIATWVVENVYRDGCRWSGTLFDPPVGPTVDDLANAIAGLEDRQTTTPVDVTIDGYSGKELRMTIPDVDFADCDEGEFRSWVAPGGGPRFHQGPGEHSRILILDVAGTRVLVFGRIFIPGTSQADRAELNQMLDSMEIDALPTPSATP